MYERSPLSVLPSPLKSESEGPPQSSNTKLISAESRMPSRLPSPTHCAGCVTVSESKAEPVPPVLVARIVIALTAAVVGVPEIKPLAVFTERPLGKPRALNEVALPLAVI